MPISFTSTNEAPVRSPQRDRGVFRYGNLESRNDAYVHARKFIRNTL